MQGHQPDFAWLAEPGWLPEVAQLLMKVTFLSLPSLEQLRRHVHHTLCAHDQLDPNQTPLHQARITRRGKLCGLFFQVQGPRLLQTYAVWAGEENRILFYDSTGLRFAETRICEGPDPLEVAA
jgi:hypothetical protein